MNNMTTLDPKSRIEYFLTDAVEAIDGDTELVYAPRERVEFFLTDLIRAIGEIPQPTQEQVTSAVDAYLDEHGIGDSLFIASADIPEVLEG